MKKVHEINRHKGKEQLMQAYRNAGWLSPEMINIARPRVTLPKSTSFNEVVTLDLKEFGSKYVLWMIDSFSRFMVGISLTNKRADTIMQAIMDSWCMNVGFPSHGFFADNG